MRRFTLMACAAMLAGSMAAPSIAADIVAPRPIYKGPAYVAPVFTWSGLYVGINGGYGFGTSSWTGGGLGTGSFSTNGWLIGGTLGYNLQTGNWVWGVEGDIDWSNNKGRHACGGGTCETSNTWLATTRGRVGYAFDRFLPYFTGGAAFGNIKMDSARRRRRQRNALRMDTWRWRGMGLPEQLVGKTRISLCRSGDRTSNDSS